jgi:hypothetical protein
MEHKNYFTHRKAALGTMHQKEKVIAPLFENRLGISVKVPNNLDTDSFGTFTLDKKRPGDQKETAVIKARVAMELLGLDIGIASEGSFGPHPTIPFANVNTEIVVYIDTKLGLQVFGGSIEVANYSHASVAYKLDEVLDFAKSIDFPKHGIVMRKAEKDYRDMVKGIRSKTELKKLAGQLLNKYGSIWLETDFRAHMNHSRMQNIKKATEDLIENLKRYCPNCSMPGFYCIASRPGLPCETCSSPTALPLCNVYVCDLCKFSEDSIYPGEKQTAYAGHCNYCNP